VDGALPGSGTQVRFRLRDVLTPDLERILEEVTPELEVTGEVMFLSDCGSQREQFAIVSMGGTMSPLVVPVDRLCRVVIDRNQAESPASRDAHRHS